MDNISINLIMRIIACMILVLQAGEALAAKMCSKGTDKLVNSCPKNKKMWTEASQRKNCTQFITDDCADLQYHCLINAYGNGTVEVCAKLTYLQGYCAEYNSLRFSITNHPLLPCTNFTNGRCHSRYKSTDAYKYQQCYELVKRPNSNDNRTTQHIQESNGILIAVPLAIVMILILLPMCLIGGLMIYHVKCHHRSCKEALRKLPLCGRWISQYCLTTKMQDPIDDPPGSELRELLSTDESETQNSVPVLGQSGINDHEEKQKEDDHNYEPIPWRNEMKDERKQEGDHNFEPIPGQNEMKDKRKHVDHNSEPTPGQNDMKDERKHSEGSRSNTGPNRHQEDFVDQSKNLNSGLLLEQSGINNHEEKQKEDDHNYEPIPGRNEMKGERKEEGDHNSEPIPQQTEMKDERKHAETDPSLRENFDQTSKEVEESSDEEEDREKKEKRESGPRLGEAIQRDIAAADKDLLVKPDDRIKEEEIKHLIPKLDSLMERLDAFGNLPRKLMGRLRKMCDFNEKFRAKDVKYVNKILNFKKTLKRAEGEVKSYFEHLAEQVKIEKIEEYLCVNESEGYSERIANLEKKIEKLESLKKSFE